MGCIGTCQSWPLRSLCLFISVYPIPVESPLSFLTLTSLTERPSGSIWNPNTCCLYSAPGCFMVIRSPKDTSFHQVLGSRSVWTVGLCSSTQEKSSCCSCEFCLWKASCLSIKLSELLLWSFSLSYYFNLWVFFYYYYSLSLPQLFLPALLFRFCFIWQPSCLCLLSVSYTCSLPHPAVFLLRSLFEASSAGASPARVQQVLASISSLT